tara:strand:- start:29778 stop:30305 length:528 start_codon:yes stop_codon:yes gene_type:complete
MNLTSLKKNTIQKFYEKELKKQKKANSKTLKSIETIGVLASSRLFGSYDISRNLSQKLNKPHKNFEIIIFENLKDDFVTQHYNTFSEKDFGMYGKVKTENLIGFMDTKYDLLINYCGPESLFTNLVALRSNATFKVSYANDAVADIYDFTIVVDGNKVDVFNDELAKYLEILKLI